MSPPFALALTASYPRLLPPPQKNHRGEARGSHLNSALNSELLKLGAGEMAPPGPGLVLIFDVRLSGLLFILINIYM